MKQRKIRKMLLGVALLMTATAGAQEFASELQMSDGETTYWYRICSAVPGMQELVMTNGIGEDESAVMHVGIEMKQTETTDPMSRWKLTAGEDGKILLTNGYTGRQITNFSMNEGNHNRTAVAEENAPDYAIIPRSQGFKITALGDNAFKLESVENDGVNRCLALAEEGSEALTYPTDNLSTSVIGWKFMLVETITAINDAATKFTIRVANKRVMVEGCKRWKLFNAQGKEMPHNKALATGVYFVKTPKKTVKVLVP